MNIHYMETTMAHKTGKGIDRITTAFAMAAFTALLCALCAGCGGDNGGIDDAGTGGGADTCVVTGAEDCAGGGDTGADAGTPLKPFTFVVISDTHTRLPGNPDDGLYDNQKNIDNLTGMVAIINEKHSAAAFVAVTGDMVGALFSEDPADYLAGEENPAEKFLEVMGGLAMPFHAALGNHDYQKSYDPAIDEGITTTDLGAIESVWKKLLGVDPYYSVVHEGIRLIFLNSNRGEARAAICAGEDVEAFCTGSFDDAQMDWLEGELAAPEPAILFFHHPPKTDSAGVMFAAPAGFLVADGDRFYDISKTHAAKVLAIFVGHGHMWEKDRLHKKIPVFETGAGGDTGGNAENVHVVTVDPAAGSIDVVIGREGVKYYSDSL
jgi:hypothetical protein